MIDIFQPRSEPARSIYDAFQAEASKRQSRTFDEWRSAECAAVMREAAIQSVQHGLRAPTFDEIMRAETYASGSIDYGAKWAYAVVDAMHRGDGE
jgi:hypothetical protein